MLNKVVLACASIGMMAQIANADVVVFDATADYSSVNNPNGVWTSGYTQGLGSSLITFDVNQSFMDGRNHWLSSTFNVSDTPTFAKNFGAEPVLGIMPGQVSLHPGPSGQYGVLRFTAPFAAQYTINAQFFEGNAGIGDTDATVLLNQNAGSPLFFAPTTDTNPSYNFQLNLAAGDFLDFAIGAKGSYIADTTPVNIQISAVPEPSTFVLVALVGSFFAVKRSRRKISPVAI